MDPHQLSFPTLAQTCRCTTADGRRDMIWRMDPKFLWRQPDIAIVFHTLFRFSAFTSRFFQSPCTRQTYLPSIDRFYCLQQCFSTFLLQENLPQMFALLMEPYAMIQVFILLQSYRTVVAIFVPGNFGPLRRNPLQPLAEPWGSAEPQLKNTG